MTYTTQQLQAMSDFERNKAIALRLYPDAAVFRSLSDDETDAITIVSGEFTKIMVDYCNNPNDIMPLAFERGVSIMRTTEKWHACSNRYIGEGLHFFDDLPLRAIACLILMMDN